MAAVADEIDVSLQTSAAVPKRRREIIFGQRLGRLFCRAQERTQPAAVEAARVVSGAVAMEAITAATQNVASISPASPPQHTVRGCSAPDVRTLQTATINHSSSCPCSVESRVDQDVAKGEPPADTVPSCTWQAVPSISMDLTGDGKFAGSHTIEAVMSCCGIPIDLTLETRHTMFSLLALPQPTPCMTGSAHPMMSMDVSGGRIIDADGSVAPPAQTVAADKAQCVLVFDCLDTVAAKPACVTTFVFDDLGHFALCPPRASTIVFEDVSHFAFPKVA